MTTFSDILYRDEALAVKEAEAGMYHALYWASIIRSLLTRTDLTIQTRASGMNAMNGAHYFELTDPVTGKVYDVRIKPRGTK